MVDQHNVVQGNRTLIDIANNIANATMHLLVYPDGVLREPSEPTSDTDQKQFKVSMHAVMCGV